MTDVIRSVKDVRLEGVAKLLAACQMLAGSRFELFVLQPMSALYASTSSARSERLTSNTRSLNQGSLSSSLLGRSHTEQKGIFSQRSGWSSASLASLPKVIASHSAAGVPPSAKEYQLQPAQGLAKPTLRLSSARSQATMATFNPRLSSSLAMERPMTVNVSWGLYGTR